MICSTASSLYVTSCDGSLLVLQFVILCDQQLEFYTQKVPQCSCFYTSEYCWIVELV
jgi:hypothetical protein